MIKIAESEIQKRMVEWRNYKNIMYPRVKERNTKLKEENRVLKEAKKGLEKKNEQMEKQVKKILLELEALKTLKFGKKREKSERAKKIPQKEEASTKPKRSQESYRRKEPQAEAITDKLRMEINECPKCGIALKEKKEHKHYREDLYEVEKLIESAKKIVETIVESGKCPECEKRQYAMEIPRQKVLIGTNIRIMVVYLVIVLGLSYEEAIKSLKHQYGINISNGEIINILEGERNLLTPYYNNLIKELEEEEGAHYDETSWKTKSYGKEISEGNYCWVKVGVKSNKRLIWFGKGRGKGVAEDLRGAKEGSIGVSDDYGGYRNCFEYHQLCWAHPQRKLRDLAESGNLTGQTKKNCQKIFREYSKVYKEARRVRKALESDNWTEDQKTDKKDKLVSAFANSLEISADDPEKLKTIKNSLKERKERYFTFFDYPFLPLDNNKAERALRKIVLKRKKSFGCRSVRGANALSVLYSVIYSQMASNPDENFFALYRQAMEYEAESK